MTSASPIAIGITAAPVTRRRGAGARTPVAGNSASTSGRNAIDPHRPHYVFDALLPPVLERVRQLVSDLVSHYSGDANAARLGQRLQPRGYVDPVAIDVILFGDYIAEVDPDAEGDALIFGRFRIADSHRPLHFGSASDCIHHARKFRQHAIASVLHDPAVVFLDFRIDQLAKMRPEPFVRAFLIGTHQARIAHHIGGEDSR
ncbi:MAG TPA: hypothetical protein VHT00_18395 [Stellaceae bacterium]|nr:hypothetical protein [Stellaceae bacterium]